jgi:hypothetical protein
MTAPVIIPSTINGLPVTAIYGVAGGKPILVGAFEGTRGEPAVHGSGCSKHMVKARERARKKLGLKRRHHLTMSYKLQRRSKSQQLGS